MNFEQWNMLIQTIALVSTMLLQGIVAVVAFFQFKKFKQDRIEHVLDEFDRQRKTFVADERGRRATLRNILKKEIG